MFEVPEVCMDDVLGILAIEKIRYDYTGEYEDTLLDEDYFPDAYYTALSAVAKEYDYGWIEMTDTYVHKFCFPAMREYYRLCREYGKINRISFKRNRFVTEATAFINSEMGDIRDYSIDWLLFSPKAETKKRWPCLTVFTAVEFYRWVELIESLFHIRSFYENGVKRLTNEINCPESKIIQLPDKTPETERKQAA